MSISAFEGDNMNSTTDETSNITNTNINSSNDNEPKRTTEDGLNIEMFGSSNVSEERFRELLDQGIFLL